MQLGCEQMVDKVLINNIEKYELSFFKIAMQLRAINYLEEKNALNEKICKCAKAKIKENLQFCTITPKPLEFYKERLGGKCGDN